MTRMSSIRNLSIDPASISNTLTGEALERFNKGRKIPAAGPKPTGEASSPIIKRKSNGLKIRIDPLDKLFSQFIRLRDKACQRCGSVNSLQAAHFHGRAEKSIRYDEDNACALCFGCHQYLDSHALDKVEFFQERLGERFDLLSARRRQRQKPDKAGLTLYYKSEIRKLLGKSL
jgi:hypothetical protein